MIIVEFGVAWLPGLLWRLDSEYDLLRLESPWVKRLPSEYVREHIKLSTQPIEVGADRQATARLLATYDGIEDLLCFSTDYPHGSMDAPDYIGGLLPSAWHSKVFCENACAAFGWPRASAACSRVIDVAALSDLVEGVPTIVRVGVYASSRSCAGRARSSRCATAARTSRSRSCAAASSNRLNPACAGLRRSGALGEPVLSMPVATRGPTSYAADAAPCRDPRLRVRAYDVEIADGRVLVDVT